ncbi:MAG: Eco29kI family restriction endonuclease [Nitrospirota bacterium]|nr:Eco29kI family restriction endonuclease [Nitrospirota bacterium]
MSLQKPYNPLDKKNLGVSVAEALLSRDILPLSSLKPFNGAGVYVIYYTGNFESYRLISKLNKQGKFQAPIYVGKAVPPGARKGGFNTSEMKTKALHNRLIEHAESIKVADNLKIEDFHCRFLVVDDIWIPLGESLLIAKFSPLWNKLIDGFGNHDPGKGRYEGLCSRWDVLHPGRSWATKCRQRSETIVQIKNDIEEYYRAHPLLAKGIFHLPVDEE